MTEEEEKRKTVGVNIRHLEQSFNKDLHNFEYGKSYPLTDLMNAIGYLHGTPKLKPRGNTK